MAALHTEYWHKDRIYVEPRSADKDILEYIRNYPEENYETILGNDNRWEVFYHLSPMRKSLFYWYPFEESAEILEIGGGMGALTGMFCSKVLHVTTIEKSDIRAMAIVERCKSCDNLDVYLADFRDVSINKKFDYVIAAGILESQNIKSKNIEDYAPIIVCLKKFLKKDGKLLIVTENRLGLRYLCGVIDGKTKKAFDGINGYEGRESYYSFSKAELEQILKAAGVSKYKFYYPLPDYKLAQAVYSENRMPHKSVRDRVIPYYENKDTLLVSELDFMDSIIENGGLSILANSFFVECSDNKPFCRVEYAALSADRENEHALVTMILENQIVRKHAIHQAGKEYLKLSVDHINDMKQHGIDIVPHSLNSESDIEMPYIDAPILMDYMGEIVQKDIEEFCDLLDRLKDAIIRSSNVVDDERNALKLKYCNDVQWGSILENAYIDMVPMNCFYQDGKIIFFDQEFVKKDFPAKYVMFRVLLYTYIFIPYAEDLLPLANLKKKYDISEELWNIFFAEEMEFVSQVRNHRIYKNFHKWSAIDRDAISRRADGLAGIVVDAGKKGREELFTGQTSQKKSEMRGRVNGQEVQKGEEQEEEKLCVEGERNDILNNVKKIQLQLLKEVAKVCSENEINFSLMYGSMLGAKRHEGIIPWDDDIDIAMLRNDYNKLLEIADKAFKEPFFLQTPENDPEVFYGGYAKLRYNDSCGFEAQNISKNCNHGIWIDIFPLDTYAMDCRFRTKQLKKIRMWQELLFAKAYGMEYASDKQIDLKEWKKKVCISRFLGHDFLCRQLRKELCGGEISRSPAVAVLSRYMPDEWVKCFDRTFFEETELISFEDMMMPIPKESDRCLEILYGKNYMRIPDKKNQVPHHKALFIPQTPYQYVKIWNEEDARKNKKVILFGTGEIVKKFLSKYEKKYPPAYLISNEKDKWGTMEQGYLVRNPERILDAEWRKSMVVICAWDYQRIEEQLLQMEISNYRFYF